MNNKHSLEIGQEVAIIDQPLNGRICRIVGNTAFVEIEGFEQPFALEKLIKIGNEMSFSYKQYDALVGDKDQPQKYHASTRKIKEARLNTKEIDLHVEKLLPAQRYKQMYPLEILEYQKEVVRREIESAIGSGVQKLVIIHGVGDGVLKDEVIHILYRYNRIRIATADFTQYGEGATTAYISATPIKRDSIF